MKKYIITIILMFLLIAPVLNAETNLPEKLAGYILLQVELHGEAWYISPSDLKRYFLGQPDDAFSLMQNLGIGIANDDLDKIPIGLIDYNDSDNDNDGLTNRFEDAIGTDPENSDSDNDGYNDKTEIENNYSPISVGKLPIDNNFTVQNSGKIFIQIENNGEAWYVNPADQKRYFLGRPDDAFSIMNELALGITNSNLYQIPVNLQVTPQEESGIIPNTCTSCQTAEESDNIISSAASAIRSGDTNETLKYFTPNMQRAIEYTMESLNADSRLTLGNILSGATLTESTEDKKTYSTEVYFSLGGYKVPIYFYIEKQTDDLWLLSNL